MQFQKVKMEILKVSKASEDGFCNEMKKKKKVEVEILFKTGRTLTAGKKALLKYEFIASEVVENGKMVDTVEYETWHLIE